MSDVVIESGCLGLAWYWSLLTDFLPYKEWKVCANCNVINISRLLANRWISIE